MFEKSRSNGKSNADVLVEVMDGAKPGDRFSYGDLATALGEHSSRKFDRRAVQGAVGQARRRILQEFKRVLRNIPGEGYCVAEAGDHMQVAGSHQRRADKQMRTGLAILRNVKWDELSATQREVHLGTLNVCQAVYANQVLLQRRQNAVEDALKGLKKQVDDLQGD